MARAAVSMLMVAGLTLSAVAAGAQVSEPDSVMAVDGGRLFKTYCASCHGKEAKGDGALAKDLKVKPADLTRLSANNGGVFPFEMVIETIDHGRSVRGHGTEDMPAWGDAFEMTSATKADAEAMMKKIAHYLWSIQSK
jgi:mono/diheme cytochrome c family protein